MPFGFDPKRFFETRFDGFQIAVANGLAKIHVNILSQAWPDLTVGC